MKGKIILFIVEGPSDHSALMPYIEKKLIDLKLRISVKEMHGDILTEYINNTRQYRVNPGNVKGELKECILEFLKSFSVKSEGIRSKDIIKIYYVTDIDYCFHNKESHHQNKSKCLSTVFNFTTIQLIRNFNIPFETIFLSKNLEHVTYGEERDFTDNEKEKMAIEFGEKSLLEDDFFVKIFTDDNLKTWNTYRESYDGIKVELPI